MRLRNTQWKLLSYLKRVKLHLSLRFVRIGIKIKTLSLLSLGYPREDKLKRTRGFTHLELQGTFLPATGKQQTGLKKASYQGTGITKTRVDWN